MKLEREADRCSDPQESRPPPRAGSTWGDAPTPEARAALRELAALLERAMTEPRTREEREADARRAAMLARARAANVEEELRRLLCQPGSMFGSGN